MLFLNTDVFDEFECIGGECEDTCCGEWAISVDKTAYDTYMNVKDEELKSKFEKSLIEYKYATKHKHAVLALNEKNQCSLLDEDGLCGIYKKMGPENMCHVCRVYPRLVNKVGDSYTSTLDLSCPEAVRKMLFREDPIEFNLIDKNIKGELLVSKMLEFRNKGMLKEDVYIELRSFVIGLLQNRFYSVEERLAILGLFVAEVRAKATNDIMENIHEYSVAISKGVFKGMCEEFDKDMLLDKEVVYSIGAYNEVIPKFVSKKLKENVRNIGAGLGINSIDSMSDFKVNYKQVKEEYYNNFIKEYEYVLENYLVANVFESCFGYSKKLLAKNFSQLVLKYAILKFTLIGLCAYHKKDMDKSKMVLAISSFERGVGHSQENGKALLKFIDDNNLEDLTNIMSLILM